MISNPGNKTHMRAIMLIVCSLFFLIDGTPARAHEINTAIAQINLQENNKIQVIIKASLESMLSGTANLPAGSDSTDHGEHYLALRAMAPAELEREAKAFLAEFTQGIQMTSDQGPVELILSSVFVPAIDDLEVMRESQIKFTGELPAKSQQFFWQWKKTNGPVVLRVDGAAGEELYSVYLQAGEKSSSINTTAASSLSTWGVMQNYIHSGFIHIVPLGLDHILFVLGLFLFSAHWRPLILQVSVFTVAHTITLALGSIGILRVAPEIVEPLIALSIVVVALENLWQRDIHPRRLLVIFAFGLLHGLGFASVLADVGLSTTHYLTALLSFNIGVELGQLLILALALLSVGWCINKHWYHSAIVVPGSLAVATVGAWWFMQRVF